jgi:hypothetical protein
MIQAKREIFSKYTEKQAHLARSEWDKMRLKRYRESQRLCRFDWEKDLPSTIVSWVKIVFADFCKDYDCTDNFRVARISKPSLGKKRYKHQKRNGCCGYFDTEVFGPDGHIYSLGFNYGH